MNPTKLIINKFEDKQSVFKAIAEKIQNVLQQELAENSVASFIVPGGTTPAPAFELLSKSDLDWSKITIAQSDERWLDASHEQSNERLTRENLLINNAKLANYVSMKNEANSIEQGESICNRDYQKIANPFTVCMVGMGLDGHIASLFPGSNNIETALKLNSKDLCIAIDATGCPVAGDYPKRMSLRLSSILNSKIILLLVTGKEKLELIEDQIGKEPQTHSPVSYILNQSTTPVEIFCCE